MKEYWILREDRRPEGPIAADEIKARLASGALVASDLVCEVGSKTWLPVGEATGGGGEAGGRRRRRQSPPRRAAAA